MNISEALEEYRAFLSGTLGPGTCDIYLRSLGRLIRHIGDKELEQLALKDFTGYKMTLAKAKRSNSYIAGEMAAFVSFLEFLKKTYRIRPVDPEDVRDLRPRVRAGDPVPLEPWQYDALIDHAGTIEERALIVLLFNTGLRISEVIGLEKGSVFEREIMAHGETLRTKWLKVIGKGRKERSVPLNKEAEEVLTKYMAFLDLKHPKGYERFFSKSYTSVWRQVKEIGKRAKVDVHPHMLRHTFATELLKKGENIVTIARIMGHESLDTTKKYTKIVDTAMVEAVKRLDATKPESDPEMEEVSSPTSPGMTTQPATGTVEAPPPSAPKEKVEISKSHANVHPRRPVTPESLRPGVKCLWNNHLMEFVERIPGGVGKPARNVFKGEDFVGFAGEDDQGFVSFTDGRLKELKWA